MDNVLTIHYHFLFEKDRSKEFTVDLNKKDLSFISRKKNEPPLWAKLGVNQCTNCTLKPDKKAYCPVAANMAHVVETFMDFFSYEDVTVHVTTDERTYTKATTLQVGLSSLIGIIMVTSGCPVLEKLKPMVRYHLPFATMEETVFRMVSMYLIGQYFKKMDGRLADWDLGEMKRVYEEVSRVNRDFAERLSVAANKDANVNALVNLDCFASAIPMTAEDMLNEIRPYFSAY